MKKISVFFAMLAVMSVVVTASYAEASTREENISKIENFLESDAIKESMEQKGKNLEEMMEEINDMGDWQIKILANNANMQVGGALDDTGVDSFWKTWGVLIIVASILPILLVLAAF